MEIEDHCRVSDALRQPGEADRSEDLSLHIACPQTPTTQTHYQHPSPLVGEGQVADGDQGEGPAIRLPAPKQTSVPRCLCGEPSPTTEPYNVIVLRSSAIMMPASWMACGASPAPMWVRMIFVFGSIAARSFSTSFGVM